MRVTDTAGATLTFRGPTSADTFSLETEAVDRVVGEPSTSETTIDDVVYDSASPATVDREHVVTVHSPLDDNEGAVTVANETPAVATYDEETGRLTRVTDGTSVLRFSSKWQPARRKRLRVERETGQSVNTFNRFATGSLAAHCTAQVDSRIASKTLATHGPLFSTVNHTTATYIRNALSWCADVDLSCLSVWNSRWGDTKRCGPLLTPRHGLFPEHGAPVIQIGDTVRYVGTDGQVYTATVANTANVGLPNSSDYYKTDLRIALYAEPLPAAVSPARVLPADWADYNPGYVFGEPTLSVDQFLQATVADLHIAGDYVSLRVPTDVARLALYAPKVTHASGLPGFLLIEDEPVLITTWVWGGAGSGPDIAARAPDINATLTTLGGGYQLTTADLTGFPTY